MIPTEPLTAKTFFSLKAGSFWRNRFHDIFRVMFIEPFRENFGDALTNKTEIVMRKVRRGTDKKWPSVWTGEMVTGGW